MAYSLSEALTALLSSARYMSSEAAGLSSELAAGSVRSSRIMDFSNVVGNLYSQMSSLQTVSGFASYAATQTNKTITGAMFTTFKNAMSDVCDAVGALITGASLYAYDGATRQISASGFTPAQTSDLRSKLAALKTAADALIP